MKTRTLPILLSLFLTGCTSLEFDAAKATAIKSRGLASIQGSQEKPEVKGLGPKIVRYLVSEVDDPKAVATKQNDVLELNPGLRTVKATAYFQIPRFGGFDVYTFSADLSLTAEPNRSYEVRGRGNETYCSLTIYDMDNNSPVSKDAVGAPILSNSHRAPIMIVY